MVRGPVARVIRLQAVMCCAIAGAALVQASQMQWAELFVEQQKVVSPDGDPNEAFGSMSISGDTVLVSAPFDDIDARVDQGSAYVFRRSGSVWTFTQKLTATDGEAGDRLGEGAPALSGDTAVLGARFADAQIDNQGAAYVFVRSGGSFVQLQKLSGDPVVGDFGGAAAVQGDTIVVGAETEDVNGVTDRGAAYVYTRSGGIFTRTQKLLASDGSARAEFGGAVAVFGDTIIVGAPSNGLAAVPGGAAYVFVRNGPGANFVEMQKLTPLDAPRQAFAKVMAFDGSTLALGSQLSPVNGRSTQGAIFIYTRSGTAFVERQQLSLSDGVAGEQFGRAFALEGNTLVAGQVIFGTEIGRAYTFTRAGTTFTETQRLTPSDGRPGDFFGSTVGFGSGFALVGAPGALGSRGVLYAFGEGGQPAPTGLTATVSGSVVSLAWQPAAGAGSYRLRAGTAPGGSNAFDGNVGNVTSLVATAPNGTYFVRVSAIGASGESAPSNEVRVDVGIAPCVQVTAPTLQAPSVTGGTVVLTWSAVQGATSYVVEAGSAAGLSNLAVLPTGNPSTTFTAVTVPRGTYFVRVRATNSCSTSAPSNERVVVVP